MSRPFSEPATAGGIIEEWRAEHHYVMPSDDLLMASHESWRASREAIIADVDDISEWFWHFIAATWPPIITMRGRHGGDMTGGDIRSTLRLASGWPFRGDTDDCSCIALTLSLTANLAMQHAIVILVMTRPVSIAVITGGIIRRLLSQASGIDMAIILPRVGHRYARWRGHNAARVLERGVWAKKCSSGPARHTIRHGRHSLSTRNAGHCRRPIDLI